MMKKYRNKVELCNRFEGLQLKKSRKQLREKCRSCTSLRCVAVSLACWAKAEHGRGYRKSWFAGLTGGWVFDYRPAERKARVHVRTLRTRGRSVERFFVRCVGSVGCRPMFFGKILRHGIIGEDLVFGGVFCFSSGNMIMSALLFINPQYFLLLFLSFSRKSIIRMNDCTRLGETWLGINSAPPWYFRCRP